MLPSLSGSASGSAMEQRLMELYPWVNQLETPIPSSWNPKDKHTFISLAHNNTKMYYKGPGKSQKDAAAARGLHPIPASCGLYYFEIKVVSKGKEGYIGIGLCLEDVNLNRLPGWDKGSYGYHGDDGHSFRSSGTGSNFGPNFTTNDVIGCGLDLVNNRCFYTKNGHNLGVAFADLPSPLFPCVGLQSTGETVETNFGQQQFMFDLSSMKKELELQSQMIITRYQPKLTRGEWEQAMQRVVSDYLVHNGYYASAESFAKSTGIEIKEQITSMSNRQNIQKLILQGKISDAIELTQTLYPGVLEKNPSLLFRLKVRQFIEMVSGADSGHVPSAKPDSYPEIIGNRLRHNRTPSPRDLHRKHHHDHHMNGGANGVAAKDDHPNGGLSVRFENDMRDSMEAEVVVEEDMGVDNVMEVDPTMPGGSVGENDYHMNGSSTSQNGDVPQSMDFDDEEEENRATCGGNSVVLIRTLKFGKDLQEFYVEKRQELGKNADNQKLLTEAFSLLAYPDPWQSQNRHLLDPLQREPVCSTLNSAILGADRQSCHPALKIIVGHCKRLFPMLAKKGSGVIAFMNIFELLRNLGIDSGRQREETLSERSPQVALEMGTSSQSQESPTG